MSAGGAGLSASSDTVAKEKRDGQEDAQGRAGAAGTAEK